MREKDWRELSVLDINAIEVLKVLYRLQRRECLSCKRIERARPCDVLPRAMFSNQLLSEIVDSHYLQGIPLARVCSRWQINYGSVVFALRRLSSVFSPVMKCLKEEYRNSFVRHADETVWRTDGENGYSWYFGSCSVSLHLYRNTRSSKVVEEILGKEKLSGYLVVDRYKGCKNVPCSLQYCYAHLLRNIKDLMTEFEDEKEVQAFSEKMISLLAQAMRLQSSRPEDARVLSRSKED